MKPLDQLFQEEEAKALAKLPPPPKMGALARARVAGKVRRVPGPILHTKKHKR